MGIFLVLLWTVTLTNFSFSSGLEQDTKSSSIPNIHNLFIKASKIEPFEKTKSMLQASTLRPPVFDKVIRTLQCANEHHIARNNILTVIDYSLPSNEKRLWVFDLNQNKMLFHTYVSHGIKSGTLFTNYFSNKHNSKASSIGVYKTDKAYYGREGLSLRLDGLEVSFNDNASNRSIVMHGAWYLSEDFIKKYGRPGRSWGCPAVPKDLFQQIINTIKDNSLFVVYYPTENWLVKSRFLNCASIPKLNLALVQSEVKTALGEAEPRDDVLFANLNKTEVIVTMPASSYQQIFQTKPPLGRMLRRQIDKMEYIALSTAEFNQLVNNHNTAKAENAPDPLGEINFVTPTIKMIRGYYETQMKIVPFDKIKEVNAIGNHYTVYFESRPALSLRSASYFIRWLGL